MRSVLSRACLRAARVVLALLRRTPGRRLSDRLSVTGTLVAHGYAADGTYLWSSEPQRNLLTNVGRFYLLDRIDLAAAGLPANEANPIRGLIVGNGTTAAAVGDTAPSGGTTYFAPIDAGFPSRSAGSSTATYQFTLTAAQGNGGGTLQQTEFGLTDASSTALTDGVLVTHLIVSGGFAKSAAVSIVYVYTLTIN